MLFGNEALSKLLKNYAFNSVLDVGCGEGLHAVAFADAGKDVTAIDLGRSIYFDRGTIRDDPRIKFVSAQFEIWQRVQQSALHLQYDCVWASHVLEHQRNPGAFLEALLACTAPNGIIAITVPPLKHAIVGGHVTLWNAGLLLYHMVLAGLDCREAIVKKYGYNISVITRKKEISLDRHNLTYDCGDINLLRDYFPLGVFEGFDGDIDNIGWYD